MSLTLQLAVAAAVVGYTGAQAIFGVGLLVFGTPTLLLLGLPFDQVLAYLLPCSIVISGVQVGQGRGPWLEGWVRRRLDALLVLLGLVHGASNLGGGILAWIVGSLHRDKHEIRRQIAFCYGLMALTQLATLLVTHPPAVDLGLCVLLPALALASYFLIGQRMFRMTSTAVYHQALTGLIAAFGILLVLAAWHPDARRG